MSDVKTLVRSRGATAETCFFVAFWEITEMLHCRKLSVCLLFLAAAGLSHSASAATVTWDPSLTGFSDGSGTWSTATANWWTGSSPDAFWSSTGTDTAVFGNGAAGTYTVTVAGPVGVGGITFNPGSNYNISSGTIALGTANGTPITMNATAGTIGALVTGSSGLTTLGTGTLFLTNAANSFTGGVFLNGGTLDFANNALKRTEQRHQLQRRHAAMGRRQHAGRLRQDQHHFQQPDGLPRYERKREHQFRLDDHRLRRADQAGRRPVDVQHAAENYYGTTTVSAGTLVLNANAGSSGTLPNSAIVIGSGGEIDLGASDYTGYGNSNPMSIYGTLEKIGNQSETLYRPITMSGGTMTSTTATLPTGNGAWDFWGNYIATARGRPTTSKVMGPSHCGRVTVATSIWAPTARWPFPFPSTTMAIAARAAKP